MSTEMGTEIDFRGLEKLVLAFLMVLVAVLAGLSVSKSVVTASAATVEHVPAAEQMTEETDLMETEPQETVSPVSLRDILAGAVDLARSADGLDINFDVKITLPTVHIITDHMEFQTRQAEPIELSLTFGSSQIRQTKELVKQSVDTILAIDRVFVADVITTTAAVIDTSVQLSAYLAPVISKVLLTSAVVRTITAASLFVGIEFTTVVTIRAISIFLSTSSLSAILLSAGLVPVKIFALPLAGFAAVLPLPGLAAFLTLIRPTTALFAADVILLLTIGILALRIPALPLSAFSVTAPAALGILCSCQSAKRKKKKPYPNGEFSLAPDMALFYLYGRFTGGALPPAVPAPFSPCAARRPCIQGRSKPE